MEKIVILTFWRLAKTSLDYFKMFPFELKITWGTTNPSLQFFHSIIKIIHTLTAILHIKKNEIHGIVPFHMIYSCCAGNGKI